MLKKNNLASVKSYDKSSEENSQSSFKKEKRLRYIENTWQVPPEVSPTLRIECNLIWRQNSQKK